jgi:hypothetical protein
MNTAEIATVVLSVWGIAIIFACAFVRGVDTRDRHPEWS